MVARASDMSKQACILPIARSLEKVPTGIDGISCMPTELFLMVIAEIHDAKTCRTCRLVSRSWDPLFLPHAFESMTVKLDSNSRKSIHTLYALLVDRADIGRSVQRLDIQYTEEAEVDILDGVDVQRGQTLTDMLFHILCCLPNLQYLHVPSALCPQQTPRWETSTPIDAATPQRSRFNLRFLHIEQQCNGGFQNWEPVISSMLAHTLDMFESVDTLHVNTTWTWCMDRGDSDISDHWSCVASSDNSHLSSPTVAVNHLMITGHFIAIPELQVHGTWLKQLHSLTINRSIWDESKEHALLEALRCMHDLEVFDASGESPDIWVRSSDMESLSEHCIPALAGCRNLRVVRVAVNVGILHDNTFEWSDLTRVLFHPLAQSTWTYPLESIQVIIMHQIVPCGNAWRGVSKEQRLQNLTAGADAMWNAAARLVEAGKVQVVDFVMHASGWGPDYVKRFQDEMQEVVPGPVAEGRFAVR